MVSKLRGRQEKKKARENANIVLRISYTFPKRRLVYSPMCVKVIVNMYRYVMTQGIIIRQDSRSSPSDFHLSTCFTQLIAVKEVIIVTRRPIGWDDISLEFPWKSADFAHLWLLYFSRRRSTWFRFIDLTTQVVLVGMNNLPSLTPFQLEKGVIRYLENTFQVAFENFVFTCFR